MIEITQQWPTLLICFLSGIVIGGLIVYIATPSKRKQHSLRKELSNTKSELEKHQRELAQHFADCAQLLDNMAGDFRQLYQQIAKNSDSLLNKSVLNNPHQLYTHQAISKANLDSKNATFTPQPPKDY